VGLRRPLGIAAAALPLGITAATIPSDIANGGAGGGKGGTPGVLLGGSEDGGGAGGGGAGGGDGGTPGGLHGGASRRGVGVNSAGVNSGPIEGVSFTDGAVNSGASRSGVGVNSASVNNGPDERRGVGVNSAGVNNGPIEGRGVGVNSAGVNNGPIEGRGVGVNSAGVNNGPVEGRGVGVNSAGVNSGPIEGGLTLIPEGGAFTGALTIRLLDADFVPTEECRQLLHVHTGASDVHTGTSDVHAGGSALHAGASDVYAGGLTQPTTPPIAEIPNTGVIKQSEVMPSADTHTAGMTSQPNQSIEGPHKAARGQERSHISAPAQEAATAASRSGAGWAGGEQVAAALACATRSFSTPVTVACDETIVTPPIADLPNTGVVAQSEVHQQNPHRATHGQGEADPSATSRVANPASRSDTGLGRVIPSCDAPPAALGGPQLRRRRAQPSLPVLSLSLHGTMLDTAGGECAAQVF